MDSRWKNIFYYLSFFRKNLFQENFEIQDGHMTTHWKTNFSWSCYGNENIKYHIHNPFKFFIAWIKTLVKFPESERVNHLRAEFFGQNLP
jgi:hypothetical protein